MCIQTKLRDIGEAFSKQFDRDITSYLLIVGLLLLAIALGLITLKLWKQYRTISLRKRLFNETCRVNALTNDEVKIISKLAATLKDPMIIFFKVSAFESLANQKGIDNQIKDSIITKLYSE